jgi:NitT/TauT family transport system substrate-binding protein
MAKSEEKDMTDLAMTRRAALGLLAAAPLAGWAAAAVAEELVKMKLVGAAAVARPDQGFLFAGIPLGFFKQLGVDADFFTVGGSGQVIQLIATNQAQLGHCGMQELMAAKKEQPSLPVRAVYLQEVGAGYEIVVPANGPIKDLGELKGKRIGVMTLASGAVPFVKAMLHNAHIEENQVVILPVGTGAQALAALQADRVDALSLFRGQHAAIENLGIVFRYFTVPYASSVLIANDVYLKNNRAALVHALQGVVLNTIYLTANPEGAVRQYWKVAGAPKGDEAKALHEGVHLIERAAELWKNPKDNRKWGAMDDSQWLDLAHFAGIEITLQQVHALYTTELIDEVNKIDPQIALRAAHNG